MPDGIENENEIARATHVPHQGDLRQHRHFLLGDAVKPVNAEVAGKLIPRGISLGYRPGLEKFLSVRVRGKK